MLRLELLDYKTFFTIDALSCVVKLLSYSHNSPEYCPCPLVPRKSACSVTVHCCGCRGPSALRGPVEPLEEAVPDELWPPGEGKDGLLYGRHPSSENTNGE